MMDESPLPKFNVHCHTTKLYSVVVHPPQKLVAWSSRPFSSSLKLEKTMRFNFFVRHLSHQKAGANLM